VLLLLSSACVALLYFRLFIQRFQPPRRKDVKFHEEILAELAS